MTCEDIEYQEVAVRFVDEPLPQMYACLLEMVPARILEVVHASFRTWIHWTTVVDSIFLHCYSEVSDILWRLWNVVRSLLSLAIFANLPNLV